MYVVVTREGVCREYISISLSSSSGQPGERSRRQNKRESFVTD